LFIECTKADDHAIVTVRFDGRRVGLIEVSWASPEASMTGEPGEAKLRTS